MHIKVDSAYICISNLYLDCFHSLGLHWLFLIHMDWRVLVWIERDFTRDLNPLNPL
jgi:hypothetical protein